MLFSLLFALFALTHAAKRKASTEIDDFESKFPRYNELEGEDSDMQEFYLDESPSSVLESDLEDRALIESMNEYCEPTKLAIYDLTGAIMKNDVLTIQTAIEDGALIEGLVTVPKVPFPMTLLMASVHFEAREVCRYLLSIGADPNLEILHTGMSALVLALDCPDRLIREMLGITLPYIPSETRAACVKCDVYKSQVADINNFYRQANFNIDAVDAAGNNILMHAFSQFCHMDIIATLLRATFQPTRPNLKGDTLLHLLLRWCENFNQKGNVKHAVDQMRRLILYPVMSLCGHLIDLPDQNDITPLHMTLASGDIRAAETLVGKGARRETSNGRPILAFIQADGKNADQLYALMNRVRAVNKSIILMAGLVDDNSILSVLPKEIFANHIAPLLNVAKIPAYLPTFLPEFIHIIEQSGLPMLPDYILIYILQLAYVGFIEHTKVNAVRRRLFE